MKRITHRPRHTKIMTHYHTHHHLLLLAILYTFLFLQSIASSSSSSPPDESCPAVSDVSCGATSDGDLPPPPRNEVYGNGRIIDITHRYVNDMPSYGSTDGIGQFVKLASSIKNGSSSNGSEMKLFVHHGTHVDAPGHFYDHYYDAGYDIDTLDLDVLNGPALLIDVPRNSNITAEVMKSLKIPKGVRRVLFRTANTDKKLMFKMEFDSSFTGFVEDGAKWLVENTDIKLVGLDYLSVAAHTDAAPVHHVFLKSREIILVEGLKLDNVKAGLYQVSCLPLRLFGAEASPARCILVK